MDYSTEIYDTVIDGSDYTFIVRWGTYAWIASAFISVGYVDCFYGPTAEAAALGLVKKLEQ